jgi:predicted transcriptional regulator
MPKRLDLSEAYATRRHSLNLSKDLSDRLRRLAFEHSLSEAAIAEYCIRQVFDANSDTRLIASLREAGAKARRTIRG